MLLRYGAGTGRETQTARNVPWTARGLWYIGLVFGSYVHYSSLYACEGVVRGLANDV